MTDVLIPSDLWDDDSEGVISAWLFNNGETVRAGDVLAEVMNEKIGSELTAPAAGRLVVLVAAEIPVRKGDVVARIVSDGG